MKTIHSVATVALVLFSGVRAAQATKRFRGLVDYSFVVETNPKEKDVSSSPVSTVKPVNAVPSPTGTPSTDTPVSAAVSPSGTPTTTSVKPVSATVSPTGTPTTLKPVNATVSPTGTPTTLKPVGAPPSGSGSDPSGVKNPGGNITGSVTSGSGSDTGSESGVVGSGGVTMRAPAVTFASCSSHPVCSELALTGDCCPTSTGIFLDCCVTSCSAHQECADLGLTGECCPTDLSEMLDCCDFDDELRKAGLARNAAAACSAYAACEGLADYCCPTFDGVFLDCCSATV